MQQKKNFQQIQFGWWFLGAYLLMVALTFSYVFTSEGDMTGLLICVAAIPWSIIGDRFFGDNGLIVGTLVGLALNGLCAYLVGHYFDQRRKKKRSIVAGPTHT